MPAKPNPLGTRPERGDRFLGVPARPLRIVDGHECSVLKGEREILHTFTPILIIELAPDALEEMVASLASLLDLLLSMGYRFYDERTRKSLPFDAGTITRAISPDSNRNVIATTPAANSLEFEGPMTTDYKIEIWKRDDLYIAEIRELSLVLSDTDPTRLSQRIEEEKKRGLEEYAEAGVVPPQPGACLEQADRASKTRRDFGIFTAKVAVVAVAASIVLVFAVDRAVDRITGVIGGASGPFHFLSIVASRLESLPEAARDKAMQDIDVIVRELEPFAVKVQPLLDPNGTHPDERESRN